jgi:phage-related protein
MRITYIGTSFGELRSRARDIAAWLSASTWAKLIINDEPDKYYLAKVTSQIDMATIYEAGEAEITFDCQPFAYSVTESEEVFTGIAGATNCDFENPGTREINFKSPQGSKSLITVVGSWTALAFTLNGKTLNYDGAGSGQTLVIDNLEMEAELGSTNVFNNLDGDIDTFLEIIPGDNVFNVSGTGLNVTVTVNYIPLWM